MAQTPASIAVATVERIDGPLALQVRDLLARSLPADLIDDRFDNWPGGPDDPPLEPGPGFRAALAHLDGVLTGYLGGGVSRGRLQLDCLIDQNLLTDHNLPQPSEVGQQLLATLTPEMVSSGADVLELWGRPAQAWHGSLARDHGFTPARALHQMRCPLPVDLEPVPTRAYRPEDLDQLCQVNNRSFVHHPDQGNQTPADLLAAMNQPWFRAEGLRIHEQEGRIAGFCWTKIHPHPDPGRRLGEIYVIGVDPDFHGRGLGRPMTAAGLRWLADQGVTTGMLYVEADNEPAVRTYLGLGFTVVRTDRSWERPLEARS